MKFVPSYESVEAVLWDGKPETLDVLLPALIGGIEPWGVQAPDYENLVFGDREGGLKVVPVGHYIFKVDGRLYVTGEDMFLELHKKAAPKAKNTARRLHK